MSLIIFAMLLFQQSISGLATNTVAVDDGLRCHDFCVEKLSSEESAKLESAQKRLDESQAAFDVVVKQIKDAHGAANPYSGTAIGLCGSYDTVEIRGKYALIQYNFNSCLGWWLPITDASAKTRETEGK